MTTNSIDKTVIRVAVASSDGKIVNEHFGVAHRFLIFEYDGNKFAFLESRESDPAYQTQRHDNNALARTAELIGDCGYIIASRIGPGAVQALLDRGIRAYVDADSVKESLEKLEASGRLWRVLKRWQKEDGPAHAWSHS